MQANKNLKLLDKAKHCVLFRGFAREAGRAFNFCKVGAFKVSRLFVGRGCWLSKKRSVLKSALLLGVAPLYFAQAAQSETVGLCGGEHRPRVDIVSRLITPQINVTQSAGALTERAKLTRQGGTDGLTEFEVDYAVTLNLNGNEAGCPVKDVQVVLSPKRLEVFIAKEVPLESCRFRAVYDHELKHVMLAQRAMDTGARPMRIQLHRFFDSYSPGLTNGDFSLLKRLVVDVVVSELGLVVDAYSRGNAALDTPEEAARLESLCSAPTSQIGGDYLPASQPDEVPPPARP